MKEFKDYLNSLSDLRFYALVTICAGIFFPLAILMVHLRDT